MERLTAEQLETFQLMVDTHGERAMTVLVSDLKALLSSHADAQRALDAAQEKVKQLDAMYRQQLDGRDKRIGELAESAKIWMERRNTLQAQLADRDAVILQMGEQAAVLAKENMAVKAQLRQVEGERDRLKGDMKERFKTIDQLDSDLTTLRQLVQALPVAGLPVEHARSDDFVVLQANGEWMVHTYNYWAKFATEDEARAYIALLEYRASLPAQPVCTNHFSDGSKIFPSRECACKPAQPAQGARCDQCGTRLAHEDHKYDCPYMIVKRQHAEGETRA